MEKYALWVYQRDELVRNRPEAERARIISACFAHGGNLAEQGVFVDGPFAETKEQLGGIEVRSALEVAGCGQTTS